MDGQTAGLTVGSLVPALFWHTLLLLSLWWRTGEGGVLPRHGSGCGAQQQKNVDNATFRHPAHIRLRRLTPALHVIQQLPEKRLQVGRGVKESCRTPPTPPQDPPVARSRTLPAVLELISTQVSAALSQKMPRVRRALCASRSGTEP